MSKLTTTIIILLAALNLGWLLLWEKVTDEAYTTTQELLYENDSLKRKLKTQNEIIETVIDEPFLSDSARDILISKWEEETGLSRLRDSLFEAIRKDHQDSTSMWGAD